MNHTVFYLFGNTPALAYAGKYLSDQGISVITEPSPEVTHLLLSIPSLEADGHIRGSKATLAQVLSQLPQTVTVLGGNLPEELPGRHCIDLLRDPEYLARNAAITADCAIRIAAENLPVVLDGCPLLVIGWGRIGKCLAFMLKNAGANVTVAARKEADRATAASLGLLSTDTSRLDFGLAHYRVIFNTVPNPVLREAQTAMCHPDCVKIDLASRPGIEGDNVIWARGLPGRDAPESSGILIAKTALRLALGKENL